MADLPDKPISRVEEYLAKIAGQISEMPPEPRSRIEQYLAYIAESGGTGGGGVGPPGPPGEAAGFGKITAEVDGSTGDPSAQAQTSGPNTALNIGFKFSGLKGEPGAPGKDGASSDVYSLNETKIGTWIDGRPIYRVVGTATAPAANATWTTVAKLAVSTNTVTNVRVIVKLDSDATFRQLPLFNAAGALMMTYRFSISSNSFDVYVTSAAGAVAARAPLVYIVEYTKTNDPATIAIQQASVQSDEESAGEQFGFEQSTDGICASYASDVFPPWEQRESADEEESI